MTLFELSAELRELEEVLLSQDGEFTDDEPGRLLEVYFDKLTGEIDRKIENYCGLIQKLKYRSEAGRAEIKRIGELATADENAMERLKARLKTFVEQHGKIRTPTVSVWVQNNSSAPLIVPIEWEQDPEKAPKNFQKVIVTLDNTAIREAIKAKLALPKGVYVDKPGTHLRIK